MYSNALFEPADPSHGRSSQGMAPFAPVTLSAKIQPRQPPCSLPAPCPAPCPASTTTHNPQPATTANRNLAEKANPLKLQSTLPVMHIVSIG
ncbi:hypothetical protein K504DRAFT_503851 [Pleomassaria siparia CBS 279.74]|uniref:Uncharacterized protein n=1 Tax=Pleomassaria siparia CBS 279.74 TaxID=1314801 RepID=A0A6G1K4T1_9PLEO|nr:hypothetical protein K504DRAFT_503851 [Pleomassaria siparia CBS 279.74]